MKLQAVDSCRPAPQTFVRVLTLEPNSPKKKKSRYIIRPVTMRWSRACYLAVLAKAGVAVPVEAVSEDSVNDIPQPLAAAAGYCNDQCALGIMGPGAVWPPDQVRRQQCRYFMTTTIVETAYV